MRKAHFQADDNYLYNFSLDKKVPQDHPIRRIRYYANEALKALSPKFDTLYARDGRPSIPPEQLLRALLLQYFYGIRSERLLIESIDMNMMFRWFVGINIDEEVWHHSSFSKNRERLLTEDVAQEFLMAIVAKATKKDLVSNRHFSVDGSLVEAWASMKSFKPKKSEKVDNQDEASTDDDQHGPGGRNEPRNFHGELFNNETHESTTDPEAKLYKKSPGTAARLSFMAHFLMENRNGLIMATRFTKATGKAEREAALSMMRGVPGKHRKTLGADKGYDDKSFVKALREMKVTPHVAKMKNRNNIDYRVTTHEGYKISLRIRKRIEECFGWMKQSAGIRKTKLRGCKRNAGQFAMVAAAFNLVRMAKLCPVA